MSSGDEFCTWTAASPRDDSTIEVIALDYNNERTCFSLDEIEHPSPLAGQTMNAPFATHHWKGLQTYRTQISP